MSSKNMRFMQNLQKQEQEIIRSYFSSNEIRKLHIGCGHHLLKGWLNVDLFPSCSEVFLMDVTQGFPFENGTFDYIYTEHMLEHIPYSQGNLMLLECFRVLKTGGKFRISTPDLEFLIDLYQKNKTEDQIEFIRDSLARWIKDSPLYYGAPSFNETFVINNYMRAWGHEFIYDENVLRDLLLKIGFARIHRVSICESKDSILQNLENTSRKPPGLVALESLIIDCEKPTKTN